MSSSVGGCHSVCASMVISSLERLMRVDDVFYGNRISPIYLEEACGDLEERAAICAMWAGWMRGQGQVRVTALQRTRTLSPSMARPCEAARSRERLESTSCRPWRTVWV